MLDEYIFSGSLPENANTYVKREADDELYKALGQGKFCYVLNSRQSGKSSLRVRTMSRLTDAGVECASIDLSSVSIQSATQENWYADLIVKLIDSFDLNVDFKDWWEKNELNSSLMRFSKFLETKLLAEISENIVIFIDEIDSVLSLKFPTDDFFAFIRSCYNQRVDNPDFNRLTFCLLGVASPSNLIEDKQRTPFNIGKAISLTGFQLHEVEPLENGLQLKFRDPQAVMKEILYWTGGQPFLTQKLCQFMVEESVQENPRSVEEVVKSRIIENWESLDEPEHLRTIRSRILRDEQRAGYLLELYQQVRLALEQSEIAADDTLEQSELQLSGLVVRQHNKLRVYNPIYQEIFDSNWIETQLKNLRPYSESFRFWADSRGTDESRLLRGKALQEAERWANDKSLSYQDKQFLAASKEKEIQEEMAVKEQEAALERERKDKEATESRNQVLAEANRKAQRQIRIGSAVLAMTLVGAAISVIWAGKDIQEIREDTQYVSQLSKLNQELEKKNKSSDANLAREQIGLSYEIRNHNLKKVMLFTSMSQAYKQLEEWNNAGNAITKSIKILEVNKDTITSNEGLQIQLLTYEIQGDLLVHQGEINKAIESYKEAFVIFQNSPKLTSSIFTKSNQFQLIKAQNINSVNRGLIDLLSKTNTEKELKRKVEQFFSNYAKTYNTRGLAYFHKKDYDHAIADYNQAIQFDPSYADAYNNRGSAYRDLKSYQDAIADFNKAIQLDPNYAYAYNNRGSAFLDLKEYNVAIADFNQAIKLDPNYATTYNIRGLAYGIKKDYNRAIADFNKAIQLDPNYVYAYNNRGSAYLDLKDYNRAIADFNQAIKLDPNYAYTYNNRGLAYGIKKDYNRAIADFTKAIELDPNYADAYYNRGLAYKNKGSLDLAIQDFKKVLELNDNVELSLEARQHLQELGIPPTLNQ